MENGKCNTESKQELTAVDKKLPTPPSIKWKCHFVSYFLSTRYGIQALSPLLSPLNFHKETTQQNRKFAGHCPGDIL